MKLSEELKNHYDSYYSAGASEWRIAGAKGKADNIVRLCSSVPHADILEIGSGDGAILNRLGELGFGERYHALEISRSGVEAILERNLPTLKECRLFNGYDIPYENDQFDVAILSHVLEHVEHPRELLAEASRVAKHLFIEVPLEDNFGLVKNYVNDGVGHINFYSPRGIRLLAQTSGLEVMTQITTDFPKKVYELQYKHRWRIYWAIKTVAIKAAPRLASLFFTYCGSILCGKANHA